MVDDERTVIFQAAVSSIPRVGGCVPAVFVDNDVGAGLTIIVCVADCTETFHLAGGT